MTRDTDAVKAPRYYDSTGRRNRAAQTRAATVQVARQLFLTKGYAATTIAEIAETAGLSQRSVYLAFGGKPGLVKAIWQAGLAGDNSVPAPIRSDDLTARPVSARSLLRAWAKLTIEVAPHVAPIVLLVRSAAATDPEMEQLLAEINRERLQRMHYNAGRLADRGRLRSGMTTHAARDVMFAYTAPELYEILVINQHWSLERYGDFVERGLTAELLATRVR